MPTNDAEDSIIDIMAFKLYFVDISLMLLVIMELLYNIDFILQPFTAGCIMITFYEKEKF